MGLNMTFVILQLYTRIKTNKGYGKCGVAVIRVSGPKASDAIINIAKFKSLPQPRHALLRSLKDPVTNETLDKGLVLWFPGPKSFTGENSCELQVHGGPAVVSSVLSALSKLPGYRPAEPGEFTKRAFHAGKLDLTEVEGLSDLIHAETEAQRKQALLQMEGNLSRLYNSWREILLKNMAHVEAFIDFSEDENIEDNIMNVVDNNLRNLRSLIQNHLQDGRCGERLRDGVRTVIVGEPNVGKSSLLNVLCQRPAAIVTPIPGTTRDVVELNVSIGGYPVIIADTAGLRSDTDDVVEKEGISRAHLYVQQADLVILVIDATKFITQLNGSSASFANFVKDYVKELGLNNVLTKNKLSESEISTSSFVYEVVDPEKCLIVLNKTDLLHDLEEVERILQKHKGVSALSCKTENGIPYLIDMMTDNLTTLCGNPSRENPCLTQSRHRHHLTDCLFCLDKYFELSAGEGDTVLAAEQLRKALRCIGKITGHVSTEEVLDVIFRDFCVGK
ncbi:tRNA modification GTPase GTPBP3, mitochondrial isoform X2 [Periplaneta americana]|uniref:tRNA modification GTPase GTPBP3, mitochondrial isoform X2 n=1 Tax=Periplaneta americana TaxID=6978 RepID=UPI0037E744A6